MSLSAEPLAIVSSHFLPALTRTPHDDMRLSELVLRAIHRPELCDLDRYDAEPSWAQALDAVRHGLYDSALLLFHGLEWDGGVSQEIARLVRIGQEIESDCRLAGLEPDEEHWPGGSALSRLCRVAQLLELEGL